MENPTQEGASIHERLMAKLDPAQPEPEKPEQPIAEDVEETTQPDDVEMPEDETDGDTQDEQSEDSELEGDDTQEADESQLTVDDLAQYLGLEADALDLDEDGDILVKTKIDGQDGTAKFKDLIASYQLRGHLNNENREVAELKKSLQSKQAALEEQAQAKLSDLDSAIQLAWSELQGEMNSQDLAELRETDPAEWAAKQEEFRVRQAKLQESYQKLAQQRAEADQKSQKAIHEHLAQEDQKLMAAIDGWSDLNKAQSEIKDVFSYLKSDYGLTDEDLFGVRDAQGNYKKLGISDHRVIVWARKAMLYDKLQKSKPEVSKKVKRTPKLVRPGQPATQEDSKATKLKNLKRKVKQEGGKGKSVADYLIAAGKV